MKQYKPFGIYRRGDLHYLGMHENEADCWRVALGWPDEEEIKAYKAKHAAICVPVRVIAAPVGAKGDV